jgi:CRISPR-associated protein Cmr4
MSENNESHQPYKEKRYIGMAVDPIHIGTGGYRLGRVDNTIARDPATNLPILFGSSIEGTARTYSAYTLIEDSSSLKEHQEQKHEKYENGKEIKKEDYLDCAGKSSEEEEKNRRIQCGICEICISYGFSNKKRSLHGMAQFSDAQILFFPIHTMLGPVWVTCPGILGETASLGKDAITMTVSNDKMKTGLVKKGEKLNLGWLYLESEGHSPDMYGKFKEVPDKILKRIVIVSDDLFSQIVNSNLDVRTSVSIDPRTGAAEEGALFTYEAIPRGTVLYFNVTFLNPRNFQILKKENRKNNKLRILKDIKTIEATVEKGLKLFEFLGLGGMGTRGFGRFKILNLKGDIDDKKSDQ